MSVWERVPVGFTRSLGTRLRYTYTFSDVELIPQAFTVKFTLRLLAAHVAEWVRQLHVDPVVPGTNPAGPDFFKGYV